MDRETTLTTYLDYTQDAAAAKIQSVARGNQVRRRMDQEVMRRD